MDGSGLEVLEGVKGKLTKATALAVMGGCLENIILLLFSSVCKCMSDLHWFIECDEHFVLFPLGDKLWWADQGTDQIGTCDKKDGSNWKVLRNSTSPMMHMKIYNETVQKGAWMSAACSLFLRLHNIGNRTKK